MRPTARMHVYRPERVMSAEPVGPAAEPLLTMAEYEALIRAVRYFSAKRLELKPDGETPAQRRQRGMLRFELQNAVSKLRSQYNLIELRDNDKND